MKKTVIALLLMTVSASGFAANFQIVVHAGNPVTTIKRPLLRDYFLGRATRWIDGSAVKPIDLAESSDVRAQFSKEVLGKDTAAVKSHWLSMVFAGRGTPPSQFDSDEKVLVAIRTTPNAIGYVSSSASLGSGVKAIAIVDH